MHYEINLGNFYSRTDFVSKDAALKEAQHILDNPQEYFPEGSEAAKGNHGYKSAKSLVEEAYDSLDEMYKDL